MVGSSVKHVVVFSFSVLLLVNLTYSTPIKKVAAMENKDTSETSRRTQTSQVSKTSGRTRDFMKDMFDWGTVTWVPLGSLLFSKKDDNESIGFAKWPIGNKN